MVRTRAGDKDVKRRVVRIERDSPPKSCFVTASPDVRWCAVWLQTLKEAEVNDLTGNTAHWATFARGPVEASYHTFTRRDLAALSLPIDSALSASLDWDTLMDFFFMDHCILREIRAVLKKYLATASHDPKSFGKIKDLLMAAEYHNAKLLDVDPCRNKSAGDHE